MRASAEGLALALRCCVEFDPELLTEKHIVELVDIAGHTVGIGNFRPEKGGRFGRFEVED